MSKISVFVVVFALVAVGRCYPSRSFLDDLADTFMPVVPAATSIIQNLKTDFDEIVNPIIGVEDKQPALPVQVQVPQTGVSEPGASEQVSQTIHVVKPHPIPVKHDEFGNIEEDEAVEEPEQEAPAIRKRQAPESEEPEVEHNSDEAEDNSGNPNSLLISALEFIQGAIESLLEGLHEKQ